MFTWFGPGNRRLIVIAVRNCSLLSQRRRSTTMRCVQADSPPPKLESEICRKQSARPASVTGVGAASAADVARAGAGVAEPLADSLMQEVRVERQLAFVVRFRLQRIRRLVFLRVAPVVLEHLGEPLDDVWLVDQHA